VKSTHRYGPLNFIIVVLCLLLALRCTIETFSKESWCHGLFPELPVILSSCLCPGLFLRGLASTILNIFLVLYMQSTCLPNLTVIILRKIKRVQILNPLAFKRVLSFMNYKTNAPLLRFSTNQVMELGLK